MVAGLSGLGKTTTCEALLQSWIQQQEQISLKPPLSDRGNNKFQFAHQNKLPGITKVVDPSRQFERYDERTNTILRVRIIDTPGFGNRVNHRDAVRPIVRYMHKCRRQQFRAETSTKLPDKDVVEACDDLVHVCLYFLSPGRFLSMDAYFLKRIQHEVSIIPVIAKADTLTNEEITAYRAELVKAFAREEIQPYNFDMLPPSRRFASSTTSAATQNQDANHGNETSPDEAETLQVIPLSRGRRAGEALGVVSRDGRYPWGAIRSMDPVHSDLILVRDLLLSQHTETFVELAREKYGLYRTRRIRRRQVGDVLKIVALGLLTAKALGVSIPFLDRFSLHTAWGKCRRMWDYLATMVVHIWNSLWMQKVTDTTTDLGMVETPPVVDAIADKAPSRRWFTRNK